ncbi:hypothetical protein GCM10010211_24130 [Streptomyces albospinus]|uniref:Uncharacterized protein n=1 Tax=Streptomyces albospinus TaxID=285515 RepID=A0ABQ2V1B6_9ACTN|nr:hypothetical protein GCM10010211_24130 [Streptomyces albospinus]
MGDCGGGPSEAPAVGAARHRPTAPAPGATAPQTRKPASPQARKPAKGLPRHAADDTCAAHLP